MRLLIDLIMGLVMAIGVVVLNWNNNYPMAHLLCDGFFAAGVLLMGMGGIKQIRNKGIFDVMGYGISSALHTAIPFTRPAEQLGQREERFEDYQARKSENRKPAGDLLVSGAIFLGLAFVMLAIYLATEG